MDKVGRNRPPTCALAFYWKRPPEFWQEHRAKLGT